MWFFVGLVSAYDGYLVVETRAVISQCEQNPMCSYLIDIDRGELSLLLRSKALGTAAVLLSLVALRLRDEKLAWPVASGLVAFQFGLLLYLTLDFPCDWLPVAASGGVGGR